MSKTSSEVKNRYNKKTYTQWNCALRKDFFEKVETLRGDMSRPEFLKMLISLYEERQD